MRACGSFVGVPLRYWMRVPCSTHGGRGHLVRPRNSGNGSWRASTVDEDVEDINRASAGSASLRAGGARLVPSADGKGLTKIESQPDDDEICFSEECSERYQEPPESIRRLVDTEMEPEISLQPKWKEYLLLLQRPSLPQIAELAYPELRLAGYRFHPSTYTPSRSSYYTSMSLQRVDDDLRRRIELDGLQVNVGKKGETSEIGYVLWSPNGSYIAFCIFVPGYGLELWTVNVETKKCRQHIPGRRLHAVCGAPFTWCPDSNRIIAKLVDEESADAGPPRKSPVPLGPMVQEYLGGRPAPARTYQDLLVSRHDRDLFEYYTSCQLAIITLAGTSNEQENDSILNIGRPGAIRRAAPSPDGNFLLVDIMQPPFEYLIPASRFPRRVEVMSAIDGSVVASVADVPLQDTIPIAFDGVGEGPRNIGWRSDTNATLFWVEAQDGGDPANEASVRDCVFTLSAPFVGAPRKLASLAWRFGGINWGNSDVALLSESWYKTRSRKTYLIAPGDDMVDDSTLPGTTNESGPCCLRACDLTQSEAPRRLIIDVPNWEDRYNSVGSIVTRTNSKGRSVVRLIYFDEAKKKPHFLMVNAGAGPEGNRPFMSVLNAVTGKQEIIWRSTPPYFENVATILWTNETTRMPEKVLFRREAPTLMPNFFVYDLAKSYATGNDGHVSSSEESSIFTEDVLRSRTKEECFVRALTGFPHPAPDLIDVQRELIHYDRIDGVKLNANLYLPPGYNPKRDGPLPVFVWAYPREFKSAQFAGQVQDSPYRFVRIARSPLYWLTQGYAILDGPLMPIIGEGNQEANDRYIEQLVMSAEAAIDYLVQRGIADRDRIAVGGHSYGAFMTANLLAHAPNLFCCGIARSGAYNRTLTPFGFQAEERTLWQAPKVYLDMSPYLFADKIQSPLLLVHGEKDDNPGTFSMQSERLYQALKGHGKVARYVVLPFEEHGYRARESILHVLHEMTNWLNEYCRPKTPSKL